MVSVIGVSAGTRVPLRTDCPATIPPSCTGTGRPAPSTSPTGPLSPASCSRCSASPIGRPRRSGTVTDWPSPGTAGAEPLAVGVPGVGPVPAGPLGAGCAGTEALSCGTPPDWLADAVGALGDGAALVVAVGIGTGVTGRGFVRPK